MHLDLIDQIDGTIEDEPIETFYFACEKVGQADGYLRILGDAGAYNFETRILNEVLVHWGWMPKDEAEKLKSEKELLGDWCNTFKASHDDLLTACKSVSGFINKNVWPDGYFTDEFLKTERILSSAIAKADGE